MSFVVDIKTASAKYFEENAVRYTEDYYFQQKEHPKWVRHKRILELVEEFVPEKRSRVLDIGCGPGLLAIDLDRKGYVGVGLDISEKMISFCKKKANGLAIESWEFVIGDAKKTGLEDVSNERF